MKLEAWQEFAIRGVLGPCQFSYRPPSLGGEFGVANVKFEAPGKRIGVVIIFKGEEFYDMKVLTRGGDFVHDRDLEKRVARVLHASGHERIELIARANQPNGSFQA